jgi:hypothetical protein
VKIVHERAELQPLLEAALIRVRDRDRVRVRVRDR